jgi:hypothetical protein
MYVVTQRFGFYAGSWGFRGYSVAPWKGPEFYKFGIIFVAVANREYVLFTYVHNSMPTENIASKIPLQHALAGSMRAIGANTRATHMGNGAM